MAWKFDESSAKWWLEDKVWKVGNMATKIMGLAVYNVAGYLTTKWHLDPSSSLAATDMGQNWGECCATFGGDESPSNTMLPGPRPTSVPSGILIHPAIWPQQTWAESWGLYPFRGGELGPHLTQCCLGWGLPPCQVSSWSIQPLGHNTPMLQTGLAKSNQKVMAAYCRVDDLPAGWLPVHWDQLQAPRSVSSMEKPLSMAYYHLYRQNRQTDRTVLQMVAQKWLRLRADRSPPIFKCNCLKACTINIDTAVSKV